MGTKKLKNKPKHSETDMFIHKNFGTELATSSREGRVTTNSRAVTVITCLMNIFFAISSFKNYSQGTHSIFLNCHMSIKVQNKAFGGSRAVLYQIKQ